MLAAGTPAGEALRAVLVALGFLGLFGIAEAWRRRGNPHPELTRKLVHLGGGLGVAVFPWIFASPWTVLGLAVFFMALLAGSRRAGLMQSVHGVSRRSEGVVYYPLAVFLLFLVGHERPPLYLIAALTLVVSDTLAALVGSAYGRMTFAVDEEDRRSVEGSAVFFLTTFLAAQVPLLLLTDTERAACVLIALQVALITTFFEAISLKGNDNLVVPLATYYLLVKMTPRDADWMAVQLVTQLAVVGTMAWIALRFRTLTMPGAIGASLFFYGALSLGGWSWGLPPTLFLAAYIAVHRRTVHLLHEDDPRHQVRAVFWVCLVPTLLFLANNALATLLPGVPDEVRTAEPLFPLYLGALAGQLGILLHLDLERWPRPVRAALPCALAAWGLLVLPGPLLLPDCAPLALYIQSTVPAFGAPALFAGLRRVGSWDPYDPRVQAVAVAGATLVGLGLRLGLQ